MSPTPGLAQNQEPPNMTLEEYLASVHLVERVARLESVVLPPQAVAVAAANGSLTQLPARVATLETHVFRDHASASTLNKPSTDCIRRNDRVPPLPVPNNYTHVIQQGLTYLGNLLDMKTALKIFDSEDDGFTVETFFTRIANKPNVVVVAYTDNENIFGGYFSEPLKMMDETYYIPDMMAVSFQVRGRASPGAFSVLNDRRGHACVTVRSTGPEGFIRFDVSGYGGFCIGGPESHNHCFSLSKAFEGMSDATLTANESHEDRLYFRTNRVVAFRLF